MNAITNFDMNDIQYLASLKDFVVTNITAVDSEVSFLLTSPKNQNVGVFVIGQIQEFDDQFWTCEDDPQNDRSYPMTNGKLKTSVVMVHTVEELPMLFGQQIALTCEQEKHVNEVLGEIYTAKFEGV
ncbi:hypothetical protein [Acinetobacter puyangensis]|uniref:hypothetical protein n=1 Tax=Acinetobacter puyangensis TaxID=1096779 RepID=UPI003A4E4814